MNQSSELQKLYKKRDSIIQEIIKLDDFRQGSLSPRYRKCGKPYCYCAKEGSEGHGPLWMLTRSVQGKTTSTTIPKEMVEKTFKQIDTFHQFQKLVKEYTETNIKICDAKLPPKKQASQEAKKKG
jgi:hypothetical protein